MTSKYEYRGYYIYDNKYILRQIDYDILYFYRLDGSRVDYDIYDVIAMKQAFIQLSLENDPNTNLRFGRDSRIDLSKDRKTYRVIMFDYGTKDPIEELKSQEKGLVKRLKRKLIKNDYFIPID